MELGPYNIFTGKEREDGDKIWMCKENTRKS